MSHTPTPWRVTEDQFGIEAQLQNGKWYDIAQTSSTDMAGAKFDNAAFIVRACNAHSELVAALINMRKALALTGDLSSIGMAADNDAALALAKVQVDIQACRPEDRAILRTEAGQEMVNKAARALHPYCQKCGWRKGGLDSWNGAACKCGHAEPAMATIEESNAAITAESRREETP